ncbi:MAG: hypothetical protein PHX25_02835 [Candidatus Pacebacteria bacterium]|nr:hypothetical protein [Candidatus Paceibacterota bacterium]
MNKLITIGLLIILVGAGFYFFKGNDTDIAVTNFEECVAQGNPVMESFPRQCRDSKTGNSFVEEIGDTATTTSDNTNQTKVLCTADQREADVCIELYEPVCATVNIQCIKAPCDPIKETFSNSCTACINPLVESYTQGECE